MNTYSIEEAQERRETSRDEYLHAVEARLTAAKMRLSLAKEDVAAAERDYEEAVLHASRWWPTKVRSNGRK